MFRLRHAVNKIRTPVRTFIYIPSSPPVPPPPLYNWTRDEFAPYISQAENAMRARLQENMTADELAIINNSIMHGISHYNWMRRKVSLISGLVASSLIPIDLFISSDSTFLTAPAWAICHIIVHKMLHPKFEAKVRSLELSEVESSDLSVTHRMRVMDYLRRTSRGDIYYTHSISSTVLTALCGGIGIGFFTAPILIIAALQQ